MKTKLFIGWVIITCLLMIASCSKSETDDKGSLNATITLDKSSITFDEFANEETISFNSSAGWTAEIINNRADGWLSISPTYGKSGDSEITISTTENDTTDDRSASICIKAGITKQIINVTQKQKDALTITSSKIEINADGGEVKVEVNANIDFEVEIEESAKDWVIHQSTRAMETSTLIFKVAENGNKEKREAKITIKSGKISEEIMIYQAGYEPSIVISQNEYIVSSKGETIAIEVASNVNVTVEMPADADWITENITRATSTNTYRFDIQPNEGEDQRATEIKFINKENNLSEIVTVTQTPKEVLVVAKDEYIIGSYGGRIDFVIKANFDVTVTISDEAKEWIKPTDSRALNPNSYISTFLRTLKSLAEREPSLFLEMI